MHDYLLTEYLKTQDCTYTFVGVSNCGMVIIDRSSFLHKPFGSRSTGGGAILQICFRMCPPVFGAKSWFVIGRDRGARFYGLLLAANN